MNDRQRDMLNRLLDGFEGKLTSSKWATIEKCSPHTALRDIQGLVDQGILTKDQGAEEAQATPSSRLDGLTRDPLHATGDPQRIQRF
ncbi:hypothetical protein [Bradyrhizobium sp. BWA-3-5]|uniref:hypothetical protein n=1 Tax=Bradyrhizobium sp. BWA-3-5 TaxID=3080013 RepID=UPI00293F6725|nr:hypothetical protein [Bradyrhizobium sp. BWA-3-5]WOH63637.1 hypothetical protein RX331_23280 [Bradyrhizobium sp. BWA-3-5]